MKKVRQIILTEREFEGGRGELDVMQKGEVTFESAERMLKLALEHVQREKARTIVLGQVPRQVKPDLEELLKS